MELGGSKNLLFMKYKALKWEQNFYINTETSLGDSEGWLWFKNAHPLKNHAIYFIGAEKINCNSS